MNICTYTFIYIYIYTQYTYIHINTYTYYLELIERRVREPQVRVRHELARNISDLEMLVVTLYGCWVIIEFERIDTHGIQRQLAQKKKNLKS